MPIDPRTPVVVGVSQRNGRQIGNEPVEMMTAVAEGALADSGADRLGSTLQSVHVIRGIWPYRDPARLVAERLGVAHVRTGVTQLGGNEVFDLVNELAADIAAGSLEAALVVSAETMRTRRRDKAANRRSPYLDELHGATPDVTTGTDRELADATDYYAGAHEPVNFYAMSEIAIRHRNGESPAAHLDRIARLWARASAVAAENPDAWITEAKSAEEIASPTDGNRMVAAPYPKLMTSNISVDQAAAAIICSVEVATAAGVPVDRMVPLRAGSGAHDHWATRTRWALDQSPALGLAGQRALDLAGFSTDDIELLDLYSCFPSAVQVGQNELGIDPRRSFTITGGLTFAGGPYNSYCMHALARAVDLIRAGARSALLSGNGGFFTKHSFTVLASEPHSAGFGHDRPQAAVDELPSRPQAVQPPNTGTIETSTVTFDKAGEPERGIVAVLDDEGSRTWTNTVDADTMHELLHTDTIGREVTITPPAVKAAPEVHLR